MDRERLISISIPSPVQRLLPPVAMGFGIAMFLYAAISMGLNMAVGSPAAEAAVVEDQPASEVVRRFALALVLGEREALGRYATPEFVETVYPASFDVESPTEDVARKIRQRIAELELARVEIERMAPQDEYMRVDATVHVFDSAHFAEWAEHHPPYNKAVDDAVADRAEHLAESGTLIDRADRAANLLIVAEAGAEAFDSIQNEISSITQAYVDEFFGAVGTDARYMIEPLPTVSFLLERRSGRWVIVSEE